jgi:hypothetical protein
MSHAQPLNVYIIGAEGGPRKIGISDNPARRLITLGASSKRPLSVLASYPRGADARTVERVAHKLLVEKRLGGEWFDVTDEQAEAAVRDAISLVDNGDLTILDNGTHRVLMPLPVSMLDRIDDYRFTRRKASRVAAITELLERALDAADADPPPPKPPRKRGAAR